MSDTLTSQDYVNLLPAYNKQKPKFAAWVAFLTAPYAALANLANSLPTLFDTDEAVGSQLDIVGLWVGISRYVATPIEGVFFTLDTAGLGVDQGILLGPYESTTGLTALDDFHYRFLIYAKIAANSWNGTAGTAQAAWALAFTNSNVTIQVQDNCNLSFTVTVTGSLTALQKSLITGGYLPLRPSTIAVTYTFVA
jgi:hypothetical protein